MDEQTRQKIIEYLRIKSPNFTDEEMEKLDIIRSLFFELEPIKQIGLLSELLSRVYQNMLRQ